MEQPVSFMIEKGSNKRVSNEYKNVETQEKMQPEFHGLYLSSAADVSGKAKKLAAALKRAVGTAIAKKNNRGNKREEFQNQDDFSLSDLKTIHKIIEQATAQQINLLTLLFGTTVVHQLVSHSTPPQEFHRLVKLMIKLKKESIFRIKDRPDGDTALHFAVKRSINLLPETMDLLDKKCYFNFTISNRHGDNLLHLASIQTSLPILQGIVCHYRGDLNAKNNFGNTALHNAAKHGNSEILQYLASLKNIDVNAENHEKQTPLHSLLLAPADNFIENLNILVSSGANINAVDVDGRNILLYAALQGWSLEATQEIVKLGGEWHSKDRKGHSILHICANESNFELLKYFISLGASANECDFDLGRSALHAAVVVNGMNAFEYLLSNGGDVNLKDVHGDTPLSLIFKSETVTNSDLSLNAIQMLIKYGKKLDAKNNNIEKLLKLAIKKRMTNLELKKIVDLVVDLSFVNEDGETLLHSMATAGNVQLVEYLIFKGADVDKKDLQGRTPLHLCVASKGDIDLNLVDFNVVDELLAFGANINATDNLGLNALLLAAKSGKGWKDLELLIAAGAMWNVTDTFGQSIVHILTKEGNVNALRYFLSRGANVNAVNSLSETPLHSAKYARQNFMEVVTVLIEHGAQRYSLDLSGSNALHAAFIAKRSPEELLFMQQYYQRIE